MSLGRREFLDAIRADPDADAPRLIYADWLEENGDAERAGLIRFQIAGGEFQYSHIDLPGRVGRLVFPDLAEQPRHLSGILPYVERGLVAGFHSETPEECDEIWHRHGGHEALTHWFHEFMLSPKLFRHPLVMGAASVFLHARAVTSAESHRALGEFVTGLSARRMTLHLGRHNAFVSLTGPLPRLTDLSLYNCHDDTVRHFAEAAPYLRRLDLSHARPRGSENHCLGLEHLRELRLSIGDDTPVETARRIDAFGATRLESLKLLGASGSWNDLFDSLPDPARLERLELGGGATPPGVRLCPNLRELTIGVDAFFARACLTRAALPALESLTALPSDQPGMLPALAEGDLLPELRSLVVGRAEGDGERMHAGPLIRHLASGRPFKLERLDLSKTRLTLAEIISLGKLDAPLEYLAIPTPTDRALTAAAVNALGRSRFGPTLRAINLNYGGSDRKTRDAALNMFGPRCDEYWNGG